jgi:RNA polymerase sigma factor (sigma-70 family)
VVADLTKRDLRGVVSGVSAAAQRRTTGLPPFQRVLDEHRGDVWRFLVASVGPTDADDCFQETFLAALRAYPRLKNDKNLKGWLLTIAHRKAIDHHRAGVRRQALTERLPPVSAITVPERDAELWERVHGLPPKQRAAVLYRYVSDLRYAEIGRLLECSEPAARRNVHEGVKTIRESWDG